MSEPPSTAPAVARPPPRARRLVRLGVPALVGCLGLIALELTIRGVLPPRPLAPHYDPDLVEVEWIDVPGGGRTFHPRPGQITFHCFDRSVGEERSWDRLDTASDGTPLGCVKYEIDETGFRAAPGRSAGEPTDVVVVGDSFVFGDAVPRGARFTEQLAARLASRGPPSVPPTVLNRGVQGLNTAGALGLYRALVRDLRPRVLVVTVVPNDAQPFAETITDGAFARAAPWRTLDEPLWRRSRLLERLATAGAAALGSRAAIENVKRSFAGDTGRAFDVALASLVLEARRDGSKVVMLLFPMTPALGRAGHYPFEPVHAHVADLASRLDVALIDLLPDTRDRDRAWLWAHPTDPHPSTALHATAAGRLADLVTPLLEPDLARSPGGGR